jgi:tetratricopeptide (TPR) repeat protein
MDVQRYLADEPVEAGPPSVAYRFRKSLRRNKGLVSAASLVLVALLVGIGGTTWGMVRAGRERDDKGNALDAERQARARTREALDEMSSRVIEDWLSRLPHRSPEQKAFLEKVAKFYEEFAAATGEDEPTLAGVADAHLRLARVYFTLDRPEEAAAAAGRAADLFRRLAGRDPPGAPYRTGLMLALNQQAKSLPMNRKSEELDPVELEAIGIAEELLAKAPNDPAAVGHLARLLIDRGYHLAYTERQAESLAVLDRALPLQDWLITAEPGNDRHLEGLARIRNYRMDCLYDLGRDDEGDRDRVAALELYEGIARRSPSASARRNAGNMRLNTGNVYGARGRFADAGAEYRKAEGWFGPLAADYPGVPEYRHQLAIVNVCWARALAAARDWPAAADKATRAFQTWKEMEYWSAAAPALTVLADCQIEAGKLDGAVRDCTTAIRWINENVAKRGSQSWTRADFASAHASRARALDRLRRYTEALADWDEAIKYVLPSDGPSPGKVNPPTRVDATRVTSPYDLLVGKAGTLTQMGRVAEAASTLRQCLDFCEKTEPDAWTTFHVRSLLGGALLGRRKDAEAEPLLLRGYEGMKQRQDKIPADARARLTAALQRLVKLYEATGNEGEAARRRKELKALGAAQGP